MYVSLEPISHLFYILCFLKMSFQIILLNRGISQFLTVNVATTLDVSSVPRSCLCLKPQTVASLNNLLPVGTHTHMQPSQEHT